MAYLYKFIYVSNFATTIRNKTVCVLIDSDWMRVPGGGLLSVPLPPRQLRRPASERMTKNTASGETEMAETSTASRCVGVNLITVSGSLPI